MLATVYAEDDEAYNIWLNEIGMPSERIVRIGDNKGAKYASDNFGKWATSALAALLRIFYDHGEEIWGGIPAAPKKTATAGSKFGTAYSCGSTATNKAI